ncbi:hypothetical protein ACIQNU_06305 [Streptomyces sp. NPDC091292]|uniref:hypothetical protein n=1 Tax=Streptomyces sp. NPDC091292 TaxID=3365991 RepID=UPI003812D3E2
MAEHDADRDESRDPDKRPVPGDQDPGGEAVPIDETAAWEAIVAGYGTEPPDPPGAKPFKSIEDLALLEAEPNGTGDDRPAKGMSKDAGPGAESSAGPASDSGSGPGSGSGSSDDASGPGKPLGSSVAFAPGVGPRDYTAPEPSDDDFDSDDEGHFVPPEPPPLPPADVTAKFAWLAVLGGPVLLLLAVLLGWEMTWWLATVGIGGFLGGFGTLVMRMRPDDEDDDPGRGAVV